jgi:hypothetical protein
MGTQERVDRTQRTRSRTERAEQRCDGARGAVWGVLHCGGEGWSGGYGGPLWEGAAGVGDGARSGTDPTGDRMGGQDCRGPVGPGSDTI